jgi:hypothetical protein
VSRYRLESGHLYVASEAFRVRLRVRPKTFQDYQGVLQRYVRPVFGERVLAGLRPLDLQAMYQHMTERGLVRAHYPDEMPSAVIPESGRKVDGRDMDVPNSIFACFRKGRAF